MSVGSFLTDSQDLQSTALNCVHQEALYGDLFATLPLEKMSILPPNIALA